MVGMKRLLSSLTYLFYIQNFGRFEDSSARNYDLAQCCLISKSAAAMAETKVASPSSEMQGQHSVNFFFFSSDQLEPTINSALQRCLFSCILEASAERAIFPSLTLQHPCHSALFSSTRDLLLQYNLELRALCAFRESRLGRQVAVNR
jgi:hypothetical protein